MRVRTRRLPADDGGCGWYALLAPPAPPQRLASLERADCVVVGAGFTGLATARRLASLRPDWRIVVLEAQRVGLGASGRNSGFVVDVGHYDARLEREGNRRLVRLGRAGVAQLGALVRTHAIDCAWSARGRLHGAVEDLGLRQLDAFVRGLEALGEPYEMLDAGRVAAVTGTTYYRAVVRTPGTATVQPAALVRGLAATLPPGVALFEESPVRAIEAGRVVRIEAGAGAVVADRLFVATNGFTPALGFLARRVFPLLTFASLTRVLTPAEQARLGGEPEWGLVPEERMGTTVRRLREGRLLIRNTVRYVRAGTVSDAERRAVRELHGGALHRRFPGLSAADLEYTWGGVLGATMNGAQFFGRLGDRVFASVAYNGVGVAMGTIAGTLLADLALGADSDLLRDLLALPGPSWVPPEPWLGIGVRATVARLQARAGAEL